MDIKQDTQTLLETLQDLTIVELINRIRSGEATGSELGVARQLLKDNDVVISCEDVDSIGELTKHVLTLSPEMCEEAMGS